MKNDNEHYNTLATAVIELVGGEENIEKVMHCVTRLRFNLKDRALADKSAIENLKGVMGVVESGGQFQVIIGQAVGDVYQEVLAQLSNTDHDVSEEPERILPAQKRNALDVVKNGFNQLLGVITGAVTPIINILAASGIIKSLLAVLTTSNLISTTGSLYLIINALADAAFFFLPIMIGFNAAKRLGGNPILTAVVGGVIIHPTVIEAANSGLTIITAGSINFPFVSYAYSIFPMIVAAWVVKESELWLKKRIPIYIQSLVTPLLVIGLASAVTFLITGPVITWLSQGLANGLQSLLSFNSQIFGAVIAGFYQILVVFGLHWGLIPLYVNDFATLGFSYLSAIVSIPAVAQGGAALAVAMKTKKANIKEIGYSSAISAFCSITEPAIYGINLRFRKPFICASIASAVGGFLIGVFRVNMWNIVGSIIGLPSFIDPENGITSNFWYAVLVTVITLALSFILTYFWGYHDDMKIHEKRQPAKRPGKKEPLAG